MITSLDLIELLAFSREKNLTLASLHAMAFLHRTESATMSQLSAEIGVCTAAITGLADRLAILGLAERNASKSDRRVTWITLTDEGRKVMNSALNYEPESELILEHGTCAPFKA